MELYESILSGNECISVVGLGYVGLPIAIAFNKKVSVIGFDSDKRKIETYKRGIDPTMEVGDKEVRDSKILFTYDEVELQKARFHIIAVPTPIKKDKTPDLSFIESASRIVGRNLKEGSVVVYESTVYPGVTEEICIPILEKESNLKCREDFKVGYSPERINPGDKEHRLENIVKIVSGVDEETLDIVSKIYSLVVDVGVYKAKSIKIAEAAKVIENSQRDINIAFMNELSIIFHKLGIDTKSVLEAASTKWNFLNFTPGLVGGHCIGVDPYYLTYKAQSLGYISQVILAGRRINDDMGKYVVENTIKCMIKSHIDVKNAKIVIFGFTFKEDCPDIRNTKVVDIVKELNEYNISPLIYDPIADLSSITNSSLNFVSLGEIKDVDVIILAVSHSEFKSFTKSQIDNLYSSERKHVLIDVKGILNSDEYEKDDKYQYWRL